jgi:hypothetical protein
MERLDVFRVVGLDKKDLKSQLAKLEYSHGLSYLFWSCIPVLIRVFAL